MYKHITHFERAKIALLLARGRTQKVIAEEIGVHPSSISRELCRNKDSDGIYRVIHARKKADKRRRESKEKDRIIENDHILYQYIASSLEHYWSPEQIAGRITHHEKLKRVSFVTIYTFLDRSRPDLKLYRRHRKHRKKSQISFKQGKKRMIGERPRLVEKRQRIGDWEGDTIVGKEKTERILTHVDRKSGLLRARRTKADSDNVRIAVSRVFKGFPCKTITYDNGSEFAAFECIEKDLDIKVYFAQPGKPNQRGCNENANGLLRQFFPKGSSFDTITNKDVYEAVRLINTRPRKRLNYLTPLEVFLREKNKLHFRV